MSIDNKINAATQAKKRWNAAHYTAVKVSIAPDVATAFKNACTEVGVSMAGKLPAREQMNDSSLYDIPF
jgi:hypothetical protein